MEKKLLNESDNIVWYGLTYGCSIYANPKLRGGMFMTVTSGENDYNKINNDNCDIELDEEIKYINLI